MQGALDNAGGQTSDIIGRKVLGALPPCILLLPPETASSNNPEAWSVAAVEIEDSEPQIQRRSDWRRVSLFLQYLRLVEMIPETKRRMKLHEGINECSFTEFMDDVGELMIDAITAMFAQRLNDALELSRLRFVRRISEIISGKQPEHSPMKANRAARESWDSLRRRLREGTAALQFPFSDLMSRNQPVLLIGLSTAQPLAMRFAEGRLGSAIDEARKVIKGRHGAGASYDFISNPLYREAYTICEEARRVVSAATCEDEEQARDKTFLDQLKRQGRLEGSGDYSGFSVRWHRHGGMDLIRCAFSLGGRPFLQQVAPEPVFVYWDLTRFPIEVFVDVAINKPWRLQLSALSNVTILAECGHRSISRHAFVKCVDADHQKVGAICTEKTRSRLLRLHREQPGFDHVACFLEELRAAGRILRYGVRERDRAIQQHNPFNNKSPSNRFQAVVRGWDKAEKFARERDAEIIRYER